MQNLIFESHNNKKPKFGENLLRWQHTPKPLEDLLSLRRYQHTQNLFLYLSVLREITYIICKQCFENFAISNCSIFLILIPKTTLKTMTIVTINNIEVKFPFPPYDIQKNYMAKVLECLETQQNGILESPTGTGKTLSLLCASLAWVQNRKKQQHEQLQKSRNRNWSNKLEDEDNNIDITVPRIIYSSRTHTQLRQAMQEMKRTEYNHMKACVLGSRQQMCIDDEVIAEKNVALKINMCRAKVKKNNCLYYNKVEQEKNKKLEELKIVDMEDMINLGRCNSFCPYYMSRELKLEADVVFIPYNYLLDPKISKTMGVDFQKDIIIFDEGHNIEKVCEESVSVQIKSSDIETAIEDISSVLNLITSNKKIDVEILFNPYQLETLREMFITFKEEIHKINLIKLSLQGTVFEGDHIFTLLQNSGINDNNFSGVIALLDNIMDFIATSKLIQRNVYSLEIFGNLLFIVFYKKGPEFRKKIKECFRIQIDDEQKSESFSQWRFSQFSQKTERILNFWCFSPGFAMNMLLDRNVHCIILTSGTLAPLKPLISELEVDFGVTIENPHIINSNQVCVKILSKGPDNQLLNSNFKNRTNPKYINSLGLVISNLIRVIPDGVLIFFPSYLILEKSIESWQESGLWDVMNRVKPIFIEPKDTNLFKIAMNDYYSKIQDPSYKGAIFIGVCRGKVSEGLDFADINGRAVFIIGLPYPPLKDPKIILKKEYLELRHSRNKEYLKGDDWYNLEATRAINQAIGRVIRHKEDYGAIILLDSRFINSRVKNNLSLWLRHYITDMKNFQDIIRNLKHFFTKIQETFPSDSSKEIKIQELMEVEASTSSKDNLNINIRQGDNLESPSKKYHSERIE